MFIMHKTSLEENIRNYKIVTRERIFQINFQAWEGDLLFTIGYYILLF